MSRRIPSVAPPLVSLFFFSAFVVAQVNVTAMCTDPSYLWTFNSIGQSPCTVAAYMLSTCFGGIYTLPPLPPGDSYGGPTRETSNTCECSTVGYSLMSACITCQDRNPFSYTEYTLNCTTTMPAMQFPNPVPAGIYVPYWALLNVTGENDWNATESHAAGATPEYGPGAIFGVLGVYTSSASTSSAITSSASTSSASASSSSTAPPTQPHSGSHGGAIAGGVIGGIAVIAVAAIFYLRRRRSHWQAASADVDASLLMPNDGTATTVTPQLLEPPLTMKLYDPNDPTTFPGYRGGPQYLNIPSVSQISSPSLRVGSGSTLFDVQTSVPNNRGYRGLPMPH
ncbi:hypothetical protein BGY98DRAFT_991461 [Russula aff. rugulosa BPL654]|nr:hypothetical protein BGY98DRAFT_991461 [Russula aff. rugulosa BPL654]